jgi:branched-chain amino acid transport system permease protein
MVTFATSQLLYLYVRKGNYSLTNGDTGLLVPVPSWLHSSAEPTNLFNFVLVVSLLGIAVLGIIATSPFGRTLVAIRDNPARVEHLGVPIAAYRLAAFVIAGYFGGLAGTLFGLFSTIVFPNVFLWTVSSDGWVMVIIGGMYHFVGPVLGAIVLHLMNFYVGRESTAILLVTGIVLLATVLLAPRGVADLGERLLKPSTWTRLPSRFSRLLGDLRERVSAIPKTGLSGLIDSRLSRGGDPFEPDNSG